MAIELLDQPQLQVNEGVTNHIYAIDRPPISDDPEAERPQSRAVGFVAVTPFTVGRIMEPGDSPYMYHDAIRVQAIIDGSPPVYDKEISPKGILGIPLSLYETRIAIAKIRAGHRVKSLLS